MKKNILSVIGAATVAAVALKLTTKYVKNEVIKELEDDGYLYDDDDCDILPKEVVEPVVH